MENNNRVPEKIKRKKFFRSAGFSLLGFSLLSQFPFNLFGKTTDTGSGADKKIKVIINPNAVNRKGAGRKNA
jgi:hypothetical protein